MFIAHAAMFMAYGFMIKIDGLYAKFFQAVEVSNLLRVSSPKY